MKKLNLILTMSLLVIAFMACEKEGPAGAQGKQGIAGPDGLQGPKGPPGQKGATGTANVIYSDWITVEPGDWNISAIDFAVFNIIAPKLTSNIMDKGQVLVYMCNAAPPAFIIYPLPFITNFKSNYYEFRAYEGKILLRISQVDGDPPLIVADLLFRYVLIPGSVNASAALNNVDLKDFNAVAEALDME